MQIQPDNPGMILHGRKQQPLLPGKHMTSWLRLAPASAVSAQLQDPALEDVSDPQYSTKVTHTGRKDRHSMTGICMEQFGVCPKEILDQIYTSMYTYDIYIAYICVYILSKTMYIYVYI